ncbi:MAG: hypothetical protein HOA04_07655 [Euryarchaeota archaeon]|jgi:hypothetical protein|nr:hypothetical protein [Euryarchaeota archaeon]MBT7938474.1 hypothetical protein [Euryarchaeota archaeon]
MKFDETPEGFTLFRQTERFSEMVKPLIKSLAISILGLTIIFILILFYYGNFSIIILPFFFAITVFFSRQIAVIRDTPICVNNAHPWIGEEDGDSIIMLHHLRGWKDSGTVNLRVVKRQLSREWAITLEDQGRTDFGLWLYQSAKQNQIDLHLILLKEATALKNMQNGSGDDFESARIREDDDSGLLERNWLDTTPGQNDIEFGALLRNGKMETDESTNSEG